MDVLRPDHHARLPWQERGDRSRGRLLPRRSAATAFGRRPRGQGKTAACSSLNMCLFLSPVVFVLLVPGIWFDNQIILFIVVFFLVVRWLCLFKVGDGKGWANPFLTQLIAVKTNYGTRRPQKEWGENTQNGMTSPAFDLPPLRVRPTPTDAPTCSIYQLS